MAREDLADLVDACADPMDDPVFAVPPLGLPRSADDRGAPAGAAAHAGGPAGGWARPLAHERVAELRAQAGVEAVRTTAPAVYS